MRRERLRPAAKRNERKKTTKWRKNRRKVPESSTTTEYRVVSIIWMNQEWKWLSKHILKFSSKVSRKSKNGTYAGEGSKWWRYCRYSLDTLLAWLRPWQCMNMLIKSYTTTSWRVWFLFYHHLFTTCHIVFAQKNHEWVVSIVLGIVMDFVLRPRTVHSSPNDGASRQDPSL